MKRLKRWYRIHIFAAGFFVGLWLNISLSVEFLSHLDLSLVAVGALLNSIWLIFSFWLNKYVPLPEKIETVFLGCWVASLSIASFRFYGAFQQYLAYPFLLGAQPQEPFLNVLKSLLLSGIFNVLERFVRLLKR